MCQIGYTAGSRSNPQLGWAQNLLWKQTEVEKDRLMYESSSVFALFWNILQNQLPDEVNDDFKQSLQGGQMVRMDTMGSQVATKGTYTIKLGDEMYKFHGVEMCWNLTRNKKVDSKYRSSRQLQSNGVTPYVRSLLIQY